MAEPSDKPINAADEADSSPASATDSPRSEGFIADAGPAFDAERAAQEPGPEPLEAEAQLDLEGWEEEVVESLLGVKGRMLHTAVGVAEQDWIYTELDLAAIAPPLTRILNRYPAVRAYAAYGDPIVLITATAAYATRSLGERRQVLAALEAQQTEQVIAPRVEAQERPTPPAPQRPDSLRAAGGVEQPAAPTPREPAQRRRRPGEANIDPDQVEWRVGE